MSVSGDFDLTRANELDYSSTKTAQNEPGSSDLHHGKIAATQVALLDRWADDRQGERLE
jgi:hypothetical protein